MGGASSVPAPKSQKLSLLGNASSDSQELPPLSTPENPTATITETTIPEKKRPFENIENTPNKRSKLTSGLSELLDNLTLNVPPQ